MLDDSFHLLGAKPILYPMTRYYIPHKGQSIEDSRPLDIADLDPQLHLNRIALRAAKDYHDNGGWDEQWPLLIVLLNSATEIGRFMVYRELVPEFTAKVSPSELG